MTVRKIVKRGGPGRPKGSTLDKTWKLTPNQMRVAEKIVSATLDSDHGGIFPTTASQLSKLTGLKARTVRDLLKRADFQAYFQHLLSADGVILEGAFWRSMALGLSIGDIKTMELYARITGKIQGAGKDAKIEITVKSPDGILALPEYTEATVIEVEIKE